MHLVIKRHILVYELMQWF